MAELVAPDPFVETANRYAGWVEKNLKLVLASFIGALGLVGLFLFVKHQSTRGAAASTSALTKAVETYNKATDLQKAATSTIPGALQKEQEKALPAFEAIVDKDAKTAAGHLARLYAADLERRLGHDEKAAALYQQYLDGAKPDDVLRFVALEGAGYANEEQKKYDEALGDFTKLLDLPKGFYKDYGYKHKARILELKGDKEGAKAAYKALLAECPDSKLRDFAEQRLAALE